MSATTPPRAWRHSSKSALGWAICSVALNFVWEVLQLPLYAIASSGTLPQLAFAVLHCTAGDLVIAMASYLAAAVALGSADWPLARPLAGALIALICGIGYTAYSEWHNVYQSAAWAYAPAMPLLFGIGLAPLLQWLLVPLATLRLLRWKLRR